LAPHPVAPHPVTPCPLDPVPALNPVPALTPCPLSRCDETFGSHCEPLRRFVAP
jgi:hypothetical protein